MAEIVTYETVAAETQSAEQIRRLEQRLIGLERELSETKRREDEPNAEVVQKLEAQDAYVDERVSKANRRREAARKALEAVK